MQLTEEWFAKRVGKITASNVGAILGHSKYRSPDDVMRAMVREHFGDEKEFLGNAATDWGNENESFARQALQDDINEEILEEDFVVHPELPWAGCSPDGRTLDKIVEIKCPYGQKLFTLADREDYYDQVQWQLFCTNTYAAIFAVWTPNELSHEICNRSDQWVLDNLPVLKDFHKRYEQIIASEELSSPYREDLIQDLSDNREWLSLAIQRQELKDEIKEKTDVLKACEALLKNMADGRKTTGGGIVVYPIAGRKTVDYRKAFKDSGISIDLDSYTKTGKPTWGIREVKNGSD